jgi:uncharacterized membrane protein YgdD (TMEM256/DUF423 family)
MKKHTSFLWAAAMGGLAVAIGAFGAHFLKPILAETGRSETFELAVRYQFYHALALFATGLTMNQIESRWLHFSGLCFLLGILFFSGSLYILCFSGLGILGAITPIGGLFFIVGWIFLFLGIYKKQKPQ